MQGSKRIDYVIVFQHTNETNWLQYGATFTSRHEAKAIFTEFQYEITDLHKVELWSRTWNNAIESNEFMFPEKKQLETYTKIQ